MEKKIHKNRKSHEQFIKEVEDRLGYDYIFHSEYIGSTKIIDVEHSICGHRWQPTANNFLRGKTKCAKCSGKLKYTTETFNELLERNSNGEFSLVSEYIWNKAYITIQHNTCGYTRRVKPYDVFHGDAGCPQCSNMVVHDKEHVELLLEDKYGTEYKLISEEVKNNRDTIIVLHAECGQEFETTSGDIINGGKGCIHCKPNGSKGELKIEGFLRENNIHHIREFSFADCRNILPLPFDFAVFDKNNSIEYLIEFDGKQHFEPIEFFGGMEGFKSTQLRDRIKNTYCKNNNIELVRISYWEEDNISEILSDLFIKQEVA